jgi:hypothetical protein
MDHASRPWGEDSIRLELPSSLVTIDGLSREQWRTIARDYASFVVGWNEASRGADMVCRAGRLEQPLALPPEQFAINGQYSPLIRRTGAGIAITGFDFLGHLDRGGSAPIHAALAVAKEEELARSFVLENFLRILLAHHALDRGGVLLHSAGVLYRDRTYLFSGRSNAGKTTLARKAAAASARVLSDDINLVIPENGAYRVHKVPFTGEFGRRAENFSGCGSFPLGGLVLLEKAPALTAALVRPAEGVAGLISGCPFVNDDAEEFPALLEVLTQLVSHTPIVRLGVARDDPFEAVMGTLLRHCEHV